MIKAVNITAGGDLTADIAVRSKDEVGKLAGAFNLMIKQMREVVLNILDRSNHVAESAQQLNSISQQTAASANETSAAMNEISTTVEQINSHVQNISAVSNDANHQANEGNRAIAKVNGQMKNIADSAAGVAAAIEGLSDKSREINQIVELITSIADQTNLLALNAAIEAARAGEHGRGFAVVAEEVRKLAEQSADAAKKIVVLVNTMQSESQKAVDIMARDSQNVDAGTRVVGEVGDNFKGIIDAVQGLSSQIQEVAAATEQMSSGVQNVASSTEEQTAAMEELSASAESMARLSDELNALVGRFKV